MDKHLSVLLQRSGRRGLFLFFCGLFGMFKGLCQQDVVELIKSQFDQYSRQHLQEKVFIHTDKSFYLAGEIIWFKIYENNRIYLIKRSF